MLKSQFFENYWRLINHIWHRFFINLTHKNISTLSLMDDLWPLFQGHMNTHWNDFFSEASGPISTKLLLNVCRFMGCIHVFPQMVAVCSTKWPPCPIVLKAAESLLEKMTFHCFFHIHAKGSQFNLNVEKTNVNQGSLFEQTLEASSSQCFILSFRVPSFLVLEKKILKGFCHIWAWRPSWSTDWNHLNKLLFSPVSTG